ncbi:MAG: DUF1844 domain-containing protein [Elusimicrobiota bacterium]|jgi:hypothetical protein|nr:DUF1844 domain-containing protein [Elusimicrobiota bacterium]
MEEKELDFNVHFFNLITLFSQTAWYQLGKVPSPVDGKISKDLKAAQFTIDTLLMLREKTKGNLSKKEESLLSASISDLQLNYADEVSKPQNQEIKQENPASETEKTE